MKPLLILTRIMCVGLFWSVFFIEGIRVIMLRNWRFDIFQTAHWHHAWNLWIEGWVINTPKEWAFVLIILTFIPLWLCGWAALSMIKWEKLFMKAAMYPWHMFKRFFYKPVKIIAHTAAPGKSVKKKKSYKEVRPRSLRIPLDDRPEPVNQSKLIGSTSSRTRDLTPAAAAAAKPISIPSRAPIPAPAPEAPKQFDHSVFQFGENSDDDFDFNIDDFDIDKASKPEKAPASRNNTQPSRKDSNKDNKRNNRGNLPASAKENAPVSKQNSGNSTLDVIKQHGYETINGATIKNNLIDFIGVARNQICLCLIDKEPGDWLADEERFNDEEPLWFSESSHRISPVRKADLSRKFLEEKLASLDLKFTVKPYVIVQIGNIINAEDMFDIWDDLKVSVTRIDRGTPKELALFAKTLDDAENSISRDDFEKVKKLIRSMA